VRSPYTTVPANSTLTYQVRTAIYWDDDRHVILRTVTSRFLR
jgi:hypothetical protein